MTDVRAAAESLLEEKPGLEDRFEKLLAIDGEQDTWTYEDVPIDSGTFGELVSRDIVEKTHGEYRLQDPDAIRQALGREPTGDNEPKDEFGHDPTMFYSLPEFHISRPAALRLSGALALVVLFRMLPYSSVFRNGDVALSGNDPYYYRYYVQRLLVSHPNKFDHSVLSALPDVIANGEPLLVVTLWWVSALFGGAVGHVLAVYPVFLAIVTALLLYWMTVRVTEDKRAGAAAVGLLAVTPAHAFRTGLGFADHHAFDYPWLALTALALVVLVERDYRDGRTWAWALTLGVGVGGQILSWDAGPLMFVPLALFAMAIVPSWLRDGRDPFLEGLPLVCGLAIGATLSGSVHVAFGWHSMAVAITPALLAGGTLGVFAFGSVAGHLEISPRSVIGFQIVGVVLALLAGRALVPSLAAQVYDGIDLLINTQGIVETSSLLSGQLGSFLAPMFLFGFTLFLALPYLMWGVWLSSRRHAPAWLAASCYGWYFLALALIQVRFAGQLALFAALFGGLGFVHLAAWVDLTAHPYPFRSVKSEQKGLSTAEDSQADVDGLESPGRREVLYTAGLGIGVGSLGMVMTPLKHGQLTTDDSMYDAARFMRGYAEDREWTYPANYVFSRWGRNRMYNWFVNGESRNYTFAQENFEEFITASDADEWYERLRRRVGFVVISDLNTSANLDGTVYDQLFNNLGCGHYRAVWIDDDQTRKVYTLVPGAIVAAPVMSDGEISVSSKISINKTTYTYETITSTTANGWAIVRVPYPGTYSFGNKSISVAEGDVRHGRIANDRQGIAHWQLNEGSGDYVIDSEGGNHGRVINGQWTDGVVNLAFEATGESYIQIPEGESISTRGGFTIAAWIRTDSNVDYRQEIRFPRLFSKADSSAYRNTSGFTLTLWEGRLYAFLGDGDKVAKLSGPFIDDSEWHHIGLVWNGSVCKLFLDGKEIGSRSLKRSINVELPLTFAAASDSGSTFIGAIDDVRWQNEADPTVIDAGFNFESQQPQ